MQSPPEQALTWLAVPFFSMIRVRFLREATAPC
jgi:hypothetical protein